MVFSKLLRRRRHPRSAHDDQLPAVITVEKRPVINIHTIGGGEGPRGEHSLGSITDSAEDRGRRRQRFGPELQATPAERVGQNNDQEPPANTVTVKTMLIREQDRICKAIEATGKKITKAIHSVASAIYALAIALSALLVTIWAVVAATSDKLEWRNLLMIACCSVVVPAVALAILIDRIHRRILSQTITERPCRTALAEQSSTVSCTDVSELEI